MSTVFSRNKGKRSRSSSNETNNSFVKNVASRVTGLIPASISKWFSSPSTSSANGSAPPPDATDSSTEDEGIESPIIAQPPPMKRMRFSSNSSIVASNYNHNYDINNQTENQPLAALVDTAEPSTSFGAIQSPPGRTTFIRDTNFISTPLRASPEKSPSESQVKNDKETSGFSPELTVSHIGRSIEMKRKSLFRTDSPANKEATISACAKTSLNTVKDPKQPAFKASLLGSPFYRGRTMYGGAGASYFNEPNVKQRRVAVVNETNATSDTMSQAARRVMDLLENYSTPLAEAKRIPYYTRTPINQTTYTDNNETLTTRLRRLHSYKMQELHVPSVSSFLRIKQRSRLMDSTTAARQLIASQSSSLNMPPYPAENKEKEADKLTTKVKSRLTRPKRGDNSNMENDMLPAVNLPTGLLQIDKDNMPKFSFGTPVTTTDTTSVIPVPPFGMSSISGTTTPLPSTQKRIEIAAKGIKPKEILYDNNFKFSSPIRISNDQPSSMVTEDFTFGSPERSLEMKSEIKTTSISSIVGSTGIKLTTTKPDDWKCSDCWVNNKPNVDKCVCCGGKKSKKTSEKISDTENLQQTESNPLLNKPTDSKKWKCEECWINNDESTEKCVCCGNKNDKKTSTTPPTETVKTMEQKDWRCADCWITNKSDVNKCAACGGVKPGAKASAPANTSQPTSTLVLNPLVFNIAKTQSEKWECPSCLVRNENDKLKCVCCETEKPGSKKDIEKKTFNFGVPNNTFKFGIDPKKQAETNKSSATSKDIDVSKKTDKSSEKNNNNLPSTPNFSFGIPVQKPAEDSTNSSQIKPKFSFGLTNKTSESITSLGTTNTFSNKNQPKTHTEAASIDNTTNKEFELEVPKTNALPISVQKPTPTFEYFGTKQTSPLLPVNSVAHTNTTLQSSTEQLKPEATTSVASPVTVNKDAPTTGSPLNVLLRSNLFGMPNATETKIETTSAVATFSPIQKAVETSSASLFKMPELPSTGSSLFMKSDASVSAVAPAPAPMTAPTATPVTTVSASAAATSVPAPASLFSFGSNQSAPPPQTESKPKFNFSFGGNTSDSTTAFKPFGASGDAASANKFTLSTAITPNNLPAANALSSGNALPSGSALTNSNPVVTNNIFGSTGQKENMWSAPSTNNSSTNLFVSNAATSTLQKPATFTFGSSTTFGSGNADSTPTFGSGQSSNPTPVFGSVQSTGSTPVFGASAGNLSATPAFGATPTPTFGSAVVNNASAPAFGSAATNNTAAPTFGAAPQPTSAPAFVSAQKTPIVFGMPNPNANNQSSLFSNNVFGSPQGAGAAAGGMSSLFGSGAQPTNATFGSPSVPASLAFGASSPTSMPTFELASHTPAPAPAFNFGAAPPSGIFGFGQQQQQSAGVYNFGGAGGTPQVQFNMGSFTSSTPGSVTTTAGRKVRKAVRRATPR